MAAPKAAHGSSCGAVRALEAESDRWFLWLSVLFAGGIVAYFALNDEPSLRLAAALLIGALGISIFARHAPMGLCLGGALLAFGAGFAAAKLRTELVRAPVSAQELRFVKVMGLVETHELRDKGRARLTLRVLSLSRQSRAGRAVLSRARDHAGGRGVRGEDRRDCNPQCDAPATP